MKTLNLFFMGLAAVSMISCSDDDSNSTSGTNADAIAVTNNMKSGTWSITSFTEDGTDETAHFAGYDFTFGENHVLTATNGTNTYSGLWNVLDSDSNDDNSNDNSNDDDIDFNIVFATDNDFDELTDDWDIESRTGTKITLVDISGGNGGTDRLIFEKN